MKQYVFSHFSFINVLLVFISIQTVWSQPGTDIVLKNLSNGAILVRLKTYHNILKAYEGKDESRYNVIVAKRDRENQELIDAFESKWVLCPVYYFYSNNSKQIKEKKFSGVLLNGNLEPVDSLPLLNNNYLIVDQNFTQGDTAKIYRGNYLSMDGDELKRQDVYAFENSNTLQGLILYTPEFCPLQYPYPYFSKKYVLFVTRTPQKMVARLQIKIIDYLTLQELK